MLKQLLLEGEDYVEHPDWRQFVEESIEEGEPIEEIFRVLNLDQQLYPNITLEPPDADIADMEDQGIFDDDEDD
jgi:hypothetical protein